MDVETWLNTTEQSGRMVGDGGSIEWSDDDAVKSGSNTEGDVAEEPPADKKGKKTFRTPITTLNMKHDPISTILGKIDAEISALSTKSQSVSSAGTGSTVVYRPSTPSRSPQRNDEDLNRSQHERSGPMKATQNFNGTYPGSSRGRESPMLNGDTNMSSRGRESPLMNNEERPHYNGRGRESPSLNVGRGRESPSMNGDDRAQYSGRGRESPSFNNEDRLHAGGRGRQSAITNGDHRMNGAPDMYTDNGDHQRRRSDLESNSSNAVDEKFKKILRKRTGYTEKSAAPPSDTDTIRTEDFNRKFQDSLVYSSEDTTEYKSDADESSSDTEKSVKGEDSLLWDYFDTVPKSVSGFQDEDRTDQTGSQTNTEEPESKSIIDRLRPKRSKSSPPVYNKHKPTNNALRKPTYVSDAESVRTEDFEFRFKDLIVNQMDSEADLTDNDPLHAKVKEILQVTLPYKKNERERTQSENGLRFRDRRKDTSNGELTYPSLRAPSDQRNNMVNGDIHHQNGDLQLSSREPPEYRNGMVDGDHSNKRKNSESFDQRNPPSSSYESSSRSRDLLTRSSTFDEVDSINSTSYDSKFSRQSSFDGHNQSLSGRSSVSHFSLSGLSESASIDLADSRTSSLTSLSNDGGEIHFQYSPLLEKLFEDAESLSLLPKQKHHGLLNKSKKDARCDLILPDEDTEEIPFAKYTFNKKPDSVSSRSTSEKSSSSGKSSRESFDKTFKRSHYMNSKSSESCLSSSLSSTHFEGENSSSVSGMNSSRGRPMKQSASLWSSFSGSDPALYPAAMHHGYQPQTGFQYSSTPMFFPQMPPPQKPAPDQVLMNLGFAEEVDSFLPARFAQDWKLKILKKQQEMYIKAQQEMFMKAQQELYFQNHPLLVAQPEQFFSTSREMYRNDGSPDGGNRSRGSSPSRNKGKAHLSPSSEMTKQQSTSPEESSTTERQSSIEKLRDLLQSDSVIASINKDKCNARKNESMDNAMDLKRKQFARARQKSLPIYLETLSEEDENSSVKSRKTISKLYMQSLSNESTKSPSENSTSDQSLPSSNRGSIGESHFTDSDINDFKFQVIKNADYGSPEKKIAVVPSICVESNPSNESLEIDEILGSQYNDNKENKTSSIELRVEPALVSTVLKDTDKDMKQTSQLTPNYLGGDMDERFFRRRSSSSLCMSPMPTSPITVIEVGLDNQNDSLDITTDSIDIDDNYQKDASIEAFSAQLEEKIQSASLESPPSEEVNASCHSEDKVINFSGKVFRSEIQHVSNHNSISIAIASPDSQDMSVQADDGTLSPILRVSDIERLFEKIVSCDNENMFYLARDFGTQYEGLPEQASIDSDKFQGFYNNLPEASSSRQHSFNVPTINRVYNTFHKEAETQTDSNTGVIDQEAQTENEMPNDEVTKQDQSTATSSNMTRCYCSCVSRSSSESSNTSDIQLSLQATIDRLEQKTRKYRSLYGKKD